MQYLFLQTENLFSMTKKCLFKELWNKLQNFFGPAISIFFVFMKLEINLDLYLKSWICIHDFSDLAERLFKILQLYQLILIHLAWFSLRKYYSHVSRSTTLGMQFFYVFVLLLKLFRELLHLVSYSTLISDWVWPPQDSSSLRNKTTNFDCKLLELSWFVNYKPTNL